MLASSLPANFPIPWGASAGVGYIRDVPTPSQISITPGAASLTDGFPPDCMTPTTAGGVPPFGQDFNGILNRITKTLQAMQAGFFPLYDATLSTAIGGYWAGAMLRSADGHAFWRSTVDNNTTNPDAGGANWVAHGVHTVFGRTGPDITAQAGDYTAAMVGAVGSVFGRTGTAITAQAGDYTAGMVGAVATVFGRSGTAITAQTGDYTAAQVGALPVTAFNSQSIGTNGYQVFPGGLIMQWGQTASMAEDTETFVSFPIAFPSACFQVQATCDYGRHTDSDVIGQVASIDTTGAWIMRDSGGGNGYNGVVYWFAIGH